MLLLIVAKNIPRLCGFVTAGFRKISYAKNLPSKSLPTAHLDLIAFPAALLHFTALPAASFTFFFFFFALLLAAPLGFRSLPSAHLHYFIF